MWSYNYEINGRPLNVFQLFQQLFLWLFTSSWPNCGSVAGHIRPRPSSLFFQDGKIDFLSHSDFSSGCKRVPLSVYQLRRANETKHKFVTDRGPEDHRWRGKCRNSQKRGGRGPVSADLQQWGIWSTLCRMPCQILQMDVSRVDLLVQGRGAWPLWALTAPRAKIISYTFCLWILLGFNELIRNPEFQIYPLSTFWWKAFFLTTEWGREKPLFTGHLFH